MSSYRTMLASAPGNRRLVKALLVTTALVSATAAAGTVQAQTAPGAGQVDEVVVTARRRAEDLQSVPVAVTAMSANTIEQLNLRNFADLRGAIPNLEVLPLATGGANLTIRGIGQGSSQVNADAKTGFYVDEMYVARQEGNQLYFYDVDNLQVLKGPQGTLFGKNTTAGAFLLNTARPGPEAGGYAKVRFGNFGRIDTEGAVNAPVSDTLMTRFSFRTQKADGHIKHILDDKTGNNINDQSVRAQVRWLPTDRFTVDALAEFNRSDTNGNESVMIGCRNAIYVQKYDLLHTVPYCAAYPILDQSNGYLTYGGASLNIPTSAARTEIATGGDWNSAGIPLRTGGGHNNPFNDTKVYTGNLRMTYDLTDDISVKSITAVRRSRGAWYNPTANVPNDIYAEYDTTSTVQLTQELNLNGVAIDGRLNYVAGAYYFRQRTHFLQDTGPDWIDPTGYTYDANNEFTGWALYAQASFKITDQIELTGGARYNKDTKEASSTLNLQTRFTGPDCGTTVVNGVRTDYFVNAFRTGQACNGLLRGAGEESWTSFDPKLQLSFQVTPDIFLYGSWARGYNAGGFNQQLGANLPGGGLIPYNPEKLTSYEVGAKTEWWDRRARANVNYFYQDYQDIQTTILVTYNGVATRAVATGATARELGIEAEFELRPIPDLALRANGAWLNQKYKSIAPSITAFTLTSPVNATPKFTYSVSGDYTFHLADERTLTASLNWRAVGKRPSCAPLTFGFIAASTLPCTIPAYGLLGGRLDFSPSLDSPWSISLWGSNLLDERPQITRNIGGGMGVDSVTPGRPREYGIEVRRLL
jgi:iron complex outermembrane receptor protein